MSYCLSSHIVYYVIWFIISYCLTSHIVYHVIWFIISHGLSPHMVYHLTTFILVLQLHSWPLVALWDTVRIIRVNKWGKGLHALCSRKLLTGLNRFRLIISTNSPPTSVLLSQAPNKYICP